MHACCGWRLMLALGGGSLLPKRDPPALAHLSALFSDCTALHTHTHTHPSYCGTAATRRGAAPGFSNIRSWEFRIGQDDELCLPPIARLPGMVS